MEIIAQARRYVSSGWQHRWKALALAWLTCLVGWTGVYLLPNWYQSSARIYADVDSVLSAALRDIAIDGSPGSQVEILQRTLLSRPNLQRVIARTDLDLRVRDEASREALLKNLAKQIRITPQTRNLFTLEYQDRDPRLARDVVQAVVNLFIESATNTDRQQMENARTFVAQQLASYETQLRDAERRRAEFRARYVDLLPSETLGGGSRLEAARQRLQQLHGELQDARMRRDLTQRQLDATPAILTADAGGGSGGGSRLAEAERNLRELRLRFTEQHPDVIAARSVITELRSSGGAAAARAPAMNAPRILAGPRPNPLYEQLKVRMVDAEAQVASLERQVRTEEGEVERLDSLARTEPQLQAQFANLDRDYSVLRKQYEELLERREALQIAGAARTNADRVRMDVVDPPTVPTLPSGPNHVLLASGVLVVGLGTGFGLVTLLVLLDRGFYTLHDLRKLGLPVLGGISATDPVPRHGLAMVTFACGLVLLVAALGGVLVGGPVLVAKLPQMVARITA